MKQVPLTVSLCCCIGILILADSCKKEKEPTDLSIQYTVTTLAGSGVRGFLDGPAAASQFDGPLKLAADAEGNVYVSERSSHSIRKISKDGMVSTLAGGTEGTADGTGAGAQFISPSSLAVDAQNNIYVVDSMRIRKISPSGNVTSLTGSLDSGYSNGTGIRNSVTGIAVDKQGTIYTIVNLSRKSRMVTITPFGQATTFIDTAQMFTTFVLENEMPDLCLDPNGDIFVANNDIFRDAIYKISQSKTITRLASPADVDGITINPSTREIFFSGSVLKCNGSTSCRYQYRIYRLESLDRYLAIAGGEKGYADGRGDVAQFNMPGGISADAAGNIYVADQENNRIRKISKL